MSIIALNVKPYAAYNRYKLNGMDSHSLLEGIFPTQGSTQVSDIVGRFFTEHPGKP